MITRTSRASLKQAGDEVMRNVRVAGQTRRKQYYMELHQVGQSGMGGHRGTSRANVPPWAGVNWGMQRCPHSSKILWDGTAGLHEHQEGEGAAADPQVSGALSLMMELQCTLLISLLIGYQCTLMCRLLKRQMAFFSISLFVLPSLQEGPGAGRVRRGHPPVRAVLPGRGGA